MKNRQSPPLSDPDAPFADARAAAYDAASVSAYDALNDAVDAEISHEAYETWKEHEVILRGNSTLILVILALLAFWGVVGFVLYFTL